MDKIINEILNILKRAKGFLTLNQYSIVLETIKSNIEQFILEFKTTINGQMTPDLNILEIRKLVIHQSANMSKGDYLSFLTGLIDELDNLRDTLECGEEIPDEYR